MIIKITNRFTGAVLWSGCLTLRHGIATVRDAMEQACRSGAYLGGADLRGADLRDAYLRDANLSDADLRGANLGGAYLSGAYLSDADLRGAYLSGANLGGANLSDADLSGANLSDADLSDADLRGAYLSGAYLGGAKGAEMAIAMTRILPEGRLIGWKKCANDVIVKLAIPENAKRSHAFGRKCRTEFAEVLEIIGASEARSRESHSDSVVYRVGETVRPLNGWDENWQEECAPGIHFFITKQEAEAYL